MFRVIITVILLLVLIIGVVLLQIFLSKKRSMWLGLTLPLICIIVSPFLRWFVTGISIFNYASFENILLLLLFNIPTAILILIYLVYREKNKRKRELDKMTAQDFE